jgi:aryl-alcohol dehydrogenase-like predicted oxidoreductase
MQRTRFGRTGLLVSRVALGGFPFGGVHRAAGWDPFTPEGRKEAVATVHAALDAGIDYIDTAPSYGDGNSESILGEALRGRRERCVLATKVGYRGLSAADVRTSVEASLARLSTDRVDIIQFHGGAYEAGDIEAIVQNGLLDALERLKDEGRVRFIGFTTEEPWTARPLIGLGRFDMVQLRYNLIYQSAALHALGEAREADMGVATMRTMTSGIAQRLLSHIAPAWRDVEDVALKFVLSDSRVHAAIVGMRWPHEVLHNVRLAESWKPELDVAELPRWTAEIYRTDDEAIERGRT